MKNLIRLKYVLLLLCLQLISCEKAPIRSDVEGFWRLERYTVLSTDETVECNRLYYSITRQVTEVTDKGGNGYGTYICRTGYEDNENTLVLRDFKVRAGTTLVLRDFKVRAGTGDNGEDAPVEGLRHYGIDSQDETKFRIVHCNGKTMTLESEYARLELRKF